MKTNLILIVFISLVARNILSTQPVVWPLNGHTYEVIDGTLPWDAAQQECSQIRSMAGDCHLVTIGSQAENDFVLSLIENAGITGEQLWIGGHDQDVEGKFVWVTGEVWDYENWDSNEPNDSGGEDCAAIYSPGNPDPAGTWNDLNCVTNTSLSYVCECGIDEPAIPTLSQWGLIILILSLIVVGTVAVRIIGNVRLKPTLK